MTETWDLNQYRAWKAETQPSKYGNRRAVVDGISFPSKAEAERYTELKLLREAGQIAALRVHPRYVLQEPFVDFNGEKHRAVVYEGDFEYRIPGKGGSRVVVEDVKGARTAVYLLKKKLFLAKYPKVILKEIDV